MLEVMSIWRGLLPGCLEKLTGVEQNMAWAAHWFEQAGIRRTILPSARCSHRRDPAIGHQAALQGHVDAQYNLGLMRLAAVVVNVTSRDSLGRTFPLFCSNVYLPVLAFCWILVGYAMIVPSFFQKASEGKNSENEAKTYGEGVLLPRLESGDGVPEETQGSSRKSVWVFSGFDKIIPIFEGQSMIT